MGFLGFLKKKPAVASTSVPPVTQNTQSNSQFDLPELPSFDSAMHSNMANDLPPLPSFDEPNHMNAPADFSLPTIPEFEIAKAPKLKDVSNMQMPPPLNIAEQAQTHNEQPQNDETQMPAVDARTPYGPVFCDVETYREILTNMSHAKDEVIQLQSFSQSGMILQQKTQVQYDEFHSTISFMAKKLLLAEAKLFK